MRKTIAFLAALCAMLILSDPLPAQPTDASLLAGPYAQIEEQARGSQVRWYMFGGWAHVNTWVDTYVAGEMKKRYDIDLVRVPMDAGVFVNKLLN